ncbi:MAG: hypothetical protein CEE42_00740 [Promethearchaeota archaeon Loki_b31]|nr:MAG: hypothetical protein CEE42_00740 [Candidatus Lokiarchaeota archaeon Loki_b31]
MGKKPSSKKTQRKSDREKSKETEKINAIYLKEDSNGEAGVLLSDEIERLVEKCELIDKEHFNKENLKPAGYLLTIGKQYAQNEEVYELDKISNEINIPPFQCVIISTAERINLPAFLIARWNLRVSMIYKGLLWLGALQVDPGWVGPLHCPIFNLSDENVTFKLGEKLALIDFVRTTKYKEGVSLPYKNRPTEIYDIYHYNTKLKSGLFARIPKRLDKMDKNIEDFQKAFSKRIDTLSTTVFSVLAILITALTIITTFSSSSIKFDETETSNISIISLILSFFAILIAFIALYKSQKKPKYKIGVKKNMHLEKNSSVKALININLFKGLKKKKEK